MKPDRKMAEDLRYRLKEYIKIKGWKTLIFRALLMIGLIYWLLPDAPPAQMPPPGALPIQTQHGQEAASVPNTAQPEVEKLEGSLTDEDLRKQMTTYQRRFYWINFQHMMTHAKAGQEVEFLDPVLSLSFRVGEKFTTQQQRVCRPFVEEIIMMGKKNQHRAVACEAGQGHWCRFEAGKQPACRFKTPKGLKGLQQELDLKLHNLGIGWDRNMHALPNF
jgi:hypothetical protein